MKPISISLNSSKELRALYHLLSAAASSGFPTIFTVDKVALDCAVVLEIPKTALSDVPIISCPLDIRKTNAP